MSSDKASIFIVRYLQLTALVTAIIGVVLLLWPEQILQWFIPGATGDFFIRFIGSALLGYATLNWQAASSNNYDVRRIVLEGNLVTLVVATILSTVGVLNHTITNYQWLLIVEHVFFTSGFVYARLVNEQTNADR
jgi:hypothetical protein